ncbi:FAD/NAD(P)-binding domain-containing protein [Mycena leptocephala]|nr:FAD/NAD(P)-binding domain-containing protein [Mycena leptocephala]
MAPENTTQAPLNVSIVGAGIAGLAAATAFRRSGHHVQIFESAEMKAEIGAAFVATLNCQRVLEHFGYSKDNLNSVNFDGIVAFDAVTGIGRTTPWLLAALKEKPNLLVHRSDLHAELQRLAIGPGDGPPAVLHLGSKVIDCEPEDGSITLIDGRVVVSDLILGADGIASFIRTRILGHVEKSVSSGWSCYRALIEMSKLESIPGLEWLREGIIGPRSATKRASPFHMLFMYPCRGGTLLNVAGLFEDPHQDDPGWKSETSRAEVLETFADFHPKFQPVLAALDERVMKWQLRKVPALPTWVRGHAALIGDAAHATLPTLAQGAAMAVEEAGALGVLFPAGTTLEDIPARLAAYQELRKERGEFVGRESLEQALLPTKFGEYQRSKEMQEYLMGYDAIEDTQQYFQRRFGTGAQS